jgi:hypothetical protein
MLSFCALAILSVIILSAASFELFVCENIPGRKEIKSPKEKKPFFITVVFYLLLSLKFHIIMHKKNKVSYLFNVGDKNARAINGIYKCFIL